MSTSRQLTNKVTNFVNLSTVKTMQSIIVSSKDRQKRMDYSTKLCSNHAVNSFDITVLEQEKSIGIEDVRTIQRNIYLKPLRSEKKAVIIRDGQTITQPAQHALLKILEEPPKTTIIILETDKIANLLPTICSRCTIVQLDNPVETVKHLPHDMQSVQRLLKADIGEKLKLAQDMGKTKEGALDFLEQLLFDIRQEVISSHYDTPISTNLLKKVQKNYTLVKTTNISPRFALEHLFLSL